MLSDWGRHLEDELMGIAPVIVFAVAHAPVDTPTAWVRGRHAPMSLFTTEQDAMGFVSDVWFREHVFFVREVPALRFDTLHGSVVVTDLWGDRGYRCLRVKRARGALRLDTPLIAIARILEEVSTRPEDPEGIVMAVLATGWAATTPLHPRVRLHAWSSMDEPWFEGPSWAAEENDHPRAGVAAVIRAFRDVNGPERIASAEQAWLHAVTQRREPVGDIRG